jgi:small subunit ribosomal protein S13
MARIAGVMLPKNKRILVGLTYIYGVGLSKSKRILGEVGIDPNLRTDALTDDQVAKIRGVLESREKVEGDLRRDIQMNIKRLMDLSSYRGLRHRKGLPVRGQRTRTNARTRKGPRKMAIAQKKAPTA